MSIIALTAGLAVVEEPAADLLQDKVGSRAKHEQVALAGRDGDLERAVVLAGHDRVPARDQTVAIADG